MKRQINIFFVLCLFSLQPCTTHKSEFKYPGRLVFHNYSIGQKVDTSHFIKWKNLYYPNFLDGWTMDNCDTLPEEYRELPIAIWQDKKDSAISLTLLNNVILNIQVWHITKNEKDSLCGDLIKKFGNVAEENNYKEPHPLQNWITYWFLQTWKAKRVIVQVGYSYMKLPNDSAPKNIHWQLVYSDFTIEDSVIDNYRGKKKVTIK